MGAEATVEQYEAELEKAIKELEEQKEAQPGSIARAMSLFKSWLRELFAKGAQQDDDDEEKDQDESEDSDEDLADRTRALLEEYGLDEEDEDEDEETEDEDEERGSVRKSLLDRAMEDPQMAEVIAADAVVASLLKSFSDAHGAQVRELRRELRELRKALNAMAEENKALHEQLEQLGRRPAGAVAPYRVIEKSAGGQQPQFPSQDEALRLAASALRKGLITAAERRQIELAYQMGRPELAAAPLFKARQAGDDSAR